MQFKLNKLKLELCILGEALICGGQCASAHNTHGIVLNTKLDQISPELRKQMMKYS